jgi:hypothetical protein
VFQSVFSSLENDVVVQFLNNIDMDDDSEMRILKMNDIHENSRLQKDEEVVFMIFDFP